MTDQKSTLAAPADLDAMPEGDRSWPLSVLTAKVVKAYCTGNKITTADLPALIVRVHEAIDGLAPSPAAPAAPDGAAKPAVPIKSSISDTHLTCLEDGLKFKSLKRHLRASHGLSPDEYRRKWGLSDGYPVVAPAYARYRSAQALSFGLGNKASAAAKGPEVEAAPPGVSKKAPRKAGAKASIPIETSQVKQSAKQPVTSKAASKAKPSPDAKVTTGETKTLPPFRYPVSRYAKKPS